MVNMGNLDEFGGGYFESSFIIIEVGNLEVHFRGYFKLSLIAIEGVIYMQI